MEDVRKGIEFTKLQVEIMRVMKQVRESSGSEREAAIRSAQDLAKASADRAREAAEQTERLRGEKSADHIRTSDDGLWPAPGKDDQLLAEVVA